jgi:hypothetical protein
MEHSSVSIMAGLTGSLLGGMATFAASWFASRRQHHTQTSIQRAARHERLYAEFISEASRHLVSAWGHDMNCPESLADIYSALERIRLTSSGPVIGAAEAVMQQVVAAYSAPNKTYEELKRLAIRGEIASPLTEFIDTCRNEAHALGV